MDGRLTVSPKNSSRATTAARDSRLHVPASSQCELSCAQLLREANSERPIPASGRSDLLIAELKKLMGILPAAVDLESLHAWEEDLARKGQHDPNALKRALLWLDPATVASRAGLDPLLWANSYRRSQSPREDSHSHFLDQHGHSQARLRIAFDSVKQLLRRDCDPRTGFKTYELGQVLVSERDLNGFADDLPAYVKPGRTLDRQEAAEFSLESLVIPGGAYAYGKGHHYGHISNDVKEGEIFHSIYLDAPLAIILRHRGQPVAVASFLADGRKSLLIRQLQTVRPRKLLQDEPEIKVQELSSNHWELESIQWKRFLIEVASKLARPLGFKEIGIQSAENNALTRTLEEDGTIHLPLDRARVIYDQFAKSIGMRKGRDGNFRMPTNGGSR